MRVENGHGKNKPNIRKFVENDMADGFNSDDLDCESGGQKKTVKSWNPWQHACSCSD